MQRMEHFTKFQRGDRIDLHLQMTHVVVAIGGQAHEKGETGPDRLRFNISGLLRPGVTAAEKRPPDGAFR